VQPWALVQADDPEAIDVFLRREDWENALAGCLRHELEWQWLLRIEEIELAAGSPNQRWPSASRLRGTTRIRGVGDLKLEPDVVAQYQRLWNRPNDG